MNFRAVINTIAFLLLILSAGMVLSAIIGFIYDRNPDGTSLYMGIIQCHQAWEMLICSLLTATPAMGTILMTRYKRGERETKVGIREGFASVGFGWIIASVFCALPFIISSDFKFVDALFESAAGLTTTGASIISDSLACRNGTSLPNGLESLSCALRFWRCLLNWFGGVGIVFFALLIQPLLNMNKSAMLYNAEVPGLKTDNSQLAPRVRHSVGMLSVVYLLLTAFAALVYVLCGMEFYDAICHAFSSVSTGGFSTKNASLGAFPLPVLHWAVIAIMFLASCNFTLILKLVTERKFLFWKDEEFRFFFKMILLAGLAVTAILWFKCPDGLPILGSAETHPRSVEYYLRLSFFHIISLGSTTGYAISDYDAWLLPPVKIIFFLIMFPAGCGGSTAGGIKCSRLIVVAKQILFEIRHNLFPRTISDIRLSGERISQSLVSKTVVFVTLYLLLTILLSSILMVTSTEISPSTAFGSVLTCLSNVGPGFDQTGPALSFCWMSAPIKYLLTLTMIAGRLELYTICVLFLPSFWKR